MKANKILTKALGFIITLFPGLVKCYNDFAIITFSLLFLCIHTSAQYQFNESPLETQNSLVATDTFAYTTAATSIQSTTHFTETSPKCPSSNTNTPVTSQTVCQGVTVGVLTSTISYTGTTGSPTNKYQWYYNTTNSNIVTGASSITGATSNAYTATSVGTEGTRFYFCVGYATDNTCAQANTTQGLASTAVQIVINATPSIPTGIGPHTFCSATNPTIVNLVATGTGTINWYSAASGGPILLTSLAATTTSYYASQTVNNCESGRTTAEVITVNTTPIAPTGNASQTFCVSSKVSGIALTGTAIIWYNALTAGSVVSGTTSLINATHYYASQTTNACESNLRLDVNAVVLPSLNYGTVSLSDISSNTHLFISALYNNGGNSGATYKTKFIELFNPTGSSISIAGYSINYITSTGNISNYSLTSALIPSGGYYLIAGATGANGSVLSATADQTITGLSPSGTAGSIVLQNSTAALTGSSDPTIVDMLGYGAAFPYYYLTNSTSTAPSTKAITRSTSGCTNTNDNSADFTSVLVSPRNSNTIQHYCGVSSAVQTICSNGIPSNISTYNAAGAVGFGYQWYYQDALVTAPIGSSTSGWTNLNTTDNANTNVYTPSSSINNNKTFACYATPTGTPLCGSGGWATGNRQLTINTVTGGVISASQNVCASTTPAGFTEQTPATGGSLIYQWQSCDVTDFSNTITNITSATNTTYSIPSTISSNTFFRRNVISSLNSISCSINSNVVSITPYQDGTWSPNAANNEWNIASNWCGNNIPTASTSSNIITGNPVIGSTSSYGTSGFVNNLTISSTGSLSISGALNIYGSLTNNGIIDATNGTVAFSGTTLQTIPSSNFINNSIKNITINNANGVMASGILNITGKINPQLGILTTGNFITLKSTSLGTASIEQQGLTSNYINGNLTIERYIPAKISRKWSFVGSPVTGSTIQNSWQQQVYITGNGTGGIVCGAASGNGGLTDKFNSNGFDATLNNKPSMFVYNVTKINGSRWVSIPDTKTNNMQSGIGYRLNIRGDRNMGSCQDQLNSGSPLPPTSVVLSANGNVSTGDLTVALNAPNQHLYTLLANPYPCEISFSSFYNDNSSVINNKMWEYSPLGNGNYTTYDQNVINNAATLSYTNTTGDYIASGEAFFVEATDGTASLANVVFKETHKTTNKAVSTEYFGVNENNILRIKLANEDKSKVLDELAIVFKNNGGKYYNPSMDAISFGGGNQQISIIKSDVKLAIAVNPNTFLKDTVLLDVNSNTAGKYQLIISNLETIDSSVSVQLLDIYLKRITDIRIYNNYPFIITNDSLSKGGNRFEIVFNKLNQPLANELYLTAKLTDEGVLIKWKGNNHQKNVHYIIQISIDGINFKNLTNSNSADLNIYSYNDKTFNPNKENYYRIKMVENDGKVSFSNVVKVENTLLNNTIFSIQPNPINNILNLISNTPSHELYSLKIINTLGEETYTNNFIQFMNNAASINIHQMAKGVYFLQLNRAKGLQTLLRFIKL